MSSTNRGDRIQLLQKVLKKHYKPLPASENRSVLDHLLFAALAEDAPFEVAEEIFQRLPELYVDFNEIRVTTVTELADALRNLPDPTAAALRLKQTLQSLFETRYSFDLEEMRKANQGKAVADLAKVNGISPFMLGFVTQQAFGGHTIPVSGSIMQIFLMTGIVSPAEADKHQTPGLERAIPKSKGHEFSSCVHQLAADYRVNPQDKNLKAILKEAGAVEIKPVEPKADPAKSTKPNKSTETAKAKPPVAKPETKPVAKDTKDTKVSKESKESKEVKAVKPAAKPTKETKASKPADTKKPTVTKKSLPPKAAPPKKPTKAKAVAPAAKKTVDKKITKRKPK